MKEKKIFKYNEDDILEILTEYLAEKVKVEEFHARAIIKGMPGKDLRIVAVVGDAADNSIEEVDLNIIDLITEYNGSHANVRHINPSNLANINTDDF